VNKVRLQVHEARVAMSSGGLSGLFAAAMLGVLASCTGEDPPLEIELRSTSVNSSSLAGELFVGGRFVAHTLQALDEDREAGSIPLGPGEYSATIESEADDRWVIHLDRGDGEAGPGVSVGLGRYTGLPPGVLVLGDKVRNVQDEIRAVKPRKFFQSVTEAFALPAEAAAGSTRSVSLRVAAYPAPTRFSHERMVLSHLGEGRWRSSSARNRDYLEAFRDMRYLVLRNLATKRYLGLPLHGGPAASKRNGLSSAWIVRGGAPVFERHY